MNNHLFNRRQFTTAVSGAIACATLARGESVGPNDKLGVCVAGVNSRGTEHIRGFGHDPRTEVRAIVDPDEAMGRRRVDEIAKGQGTKPTYFKDIRDAIEMPGIDIVSAATPNHWHALMGIWAMQAGKDVYIEKPICHNMHEGQALVAAAKKYGRQCQTGSQCRSSGAIRDAVKFIAEGGIGEVKLARGLCYKRRRSIGPLGNYAIPKSVDFDLWTGPATITDPKVTREQFHYDWHWQRHYGNGDLGNQGPHQTDIARWGLGLDRHPNSILTYGGRLGYQAERKDPNYVDAGDTGNTEVTVYDYGDKCIVFETRGLDCKTTSGAEIDHFFGNDSSNKIGVIFYGSNGYLAHTSYEACTAYDMDKNIIKTFRSGGTGDAHFANFIDACLSSGSVSPNADARTGYLSAGMSHLGNISYYLGEQNHASEEEIHKALQAVSTLDNNAETLDRTINHLVKNGVDLDKTPLSLGPQLMFSPQTERFVGNPKADEMLSREYRKGYEVPAADQV